MKKGLSLTIILFLSIETHAFTIACAANFKPTLLALTASFSEIHGADKIKIVTGSSGMLFTQIKQGAPFDLYLSADEDRPLRLETELGIKSFIYAIGKLVFWQKSGAIINKKSFDEYKGKLAIANPRIAPYGIAAIQTLDAMNARNIKLIKGNNINQSYQFVFSGNVSAGLLSLSQMIQGHHFDYWLIPDSFYSPIKQRGIVINQKDKQVIEFSKFLQSETAKTIISRSGYGLPAL